MIPRALLFGNASIANPSISPDGNWLAWAASADQIMNLWVAPRVDMGAARQVTFDTGRGVTGHFWSKDSAYLLFSQDTDGDENFKLHAVELATGEQRCLTPFDGTRASIAYISRKTPGKILVNLNRRDKRFADLFTLELASGEMALVAENPGVASFIVDDSYNVRFAVGPTADGGRQLLEPSDTGDWRTCSVAGPEDARNTGWAHVDSAGTTLYAFDSRDRDTSALVAIDLATRETTVLGASPLADVNSMITDMKTYRPVAFWTHHERPTIHVLDESVRADVDFLNAQDIGQWGISSRTLDDRIWLVGSSSDTQTGVTWLYERSAKTLEQLFVHRPELQDLPMARMQSTIVHARDGLKLVCYLTLPRDADTGEPLKAKSPLPMALLVHGGPWDRDRFGFNSMHQLLADRGYAVLNVNFRSSTGFGKRFINAGDGQWGRKMDDDLDDAVDWAIAAGIADPKRIAIVGGSYGGFAVLSALTKQPGRYACGVDIVGPSNLQSLLAAIPPHWEHERQMLYRAVGNPTTPQGIAELKARSPLHAAGNITDPLMIAQGANDPRVPQTESDQMVDKLVSRGIPVTYVLFPDEGHGFSREPNRLVFNAMMEAFLARHLGGEMEPFEVEDFVGTTMQVRQGDLPYGRS
ncbi:S9 family peptidase [Paucibacter sp. PLA-PC-4]|uniref:S9 family peptidase n=1 Tax=Paucibacter sp. PLA-PC-4 TaxID=2993655 RepID=UPI00224B870A|nr:S9 family peptidase [Paucibacter sp. PLA-PC-4]MCX2863721.1 S9 family peptidase [Paucibacter sp. PLA-PC-4]